MEKWKTTWIWYFH